MRPLFLFFTIAILAAPPSLMAGEDAPKPKVGAVFSKLTNQNEPGLAVLVTKDGKLLFEKGYGVRNLATKAKIDAKTNFRLASCTKQFTAMAIMLLVHDGKLRYEETVEKNKGRLWSEEHQIQDDEVLALLKEEKTGKFAPGTSWSYSNSGYVVLGLIVAKVSGQSYSEFVRARIFAPLEMNQTVVYLKGKNQVTNRAYGYTKEGSTLHETDQSSTSATPGDGGVYSNLEDLSKWDAGLRNYTLLSAEEMTPALTPVRLAEGAQPHWTCGFVPTAGRGKSSRPMRRRRLFRISDIRALTQPSCHPEWRVVCVRRISTKASSKILARNAQPMPASLPSPFIFERAAMAPYCFIICRICMYCLMT
jgi:CubicO group peptidase (beta-lactamase class C family)